MMLKIVDGATVPFQNGIPVPTFEPQDRPVIALNGKWLKKRFHADHDLTMSPRNQAWLMELGAREKNFLTEREFRDWAPHEVPLPENRLNGREAANAAETYEDGVWYCRTFHVDLTEPGQIYTLKALAMSYVADIWINGEWAGYHEGGFTPFALDVTPLLHDGENEIRIRIDNPPWGSRIDTIPAVKGTDFFNYTGIIHDLYIEVTDAVHIVRADIVPLSTSGDLKITVVLENRGNAGRTVLLSGAFYETDPKREDFLDSPLASGIIEGPAEINKELVESVSIAAGETRAVLFHATIVSPRLWSIWEPNLYVAQFSLSENGTCIDRLSTQFGVRVVRTDRTRILLNDAPVFLAGIARHEEWPEFGRTGAWERIRDDLRQIRQLHANMVRTGHYPNHVYTYLLLDRLGLLAMSEIPLWQLETEHFKVQEERKLPEQMWREMVFSQYNRPSVILWSTQNESRDVWHRLAYNRRLVREVRECYDDGRLITQSAAADQPGAYDPSMEPLDVAGWTMYFGIFHGGTFYEGTRKFLEEAHRAYPGKPILNTEFGHWTGERDQEEDKQLATYADTLRALMEKAALRPDGTVNPDGYVAGIDFWIMYNWYVNHNQWVNTFGIYHMDRQKAKSVARLIKNDYGKITGPNRGIALSGEGQAGRMKENRGGDA